MRGRFETLRYRLEKYEVWEDTYFEWIPLACTKEEIALVRQRRLAISRYDERDGCIDGYIDLWIDDPVKEHISILGEFGTRKTWFA
jgi:predicted NACHT family NTPase